MIDYLEGWDMLPWDLKWFKLAKFTALNFSKDPSSKVGCAIVSEDNNLISVGWNGFPRDFNIYSEDTCDRETKYDYIIHAEENAILNSSILHLIKNGTFYVWGVLNCHKCAGRIRQTKPRRVLSFVERDQADNWIESYEKSVQLYKNVNIHATAYKGHLDYED